MKQQLFQITLLVNDYDEAMAFYTEKLNFDLLEDTEMSSVKRWVVVQPKGSNTRLLLAKANSEEQKKQIGSQAGGRVFLFLHTDNLERDYANLIEQNVTIVREPATFEYGKVLVFEDLYGNLFDLIQPPD